MSAKRNWVKFEWEKGKERGKRLKQRRAMVNWPECGPIRPIGWLAGRAGCAWVVGQLWGALCGIACLSCRYRPLAVAGCGWLWLGGWTWLDVQRVGRGAWES